MGAASGSINATPDGAPTIEAEPLVFRLPLPSDSQIAPLAPDGEPAWAAGSAELGDDE